MPIMPGKPRPTPIQQRITLPPLPNASAGQYYDAPFAAPDIIAVVPPVASGLLWHNGRLSGTPHHAGDILLDILVRGANGTQRIAHPLHVNPDPRSLWRDLPSDAADPFHKPDHANRRLDSAAASLLAARVRGRAHAHSGGFCDDDYRLAIDPASGAHILAVADGAGSAAYSRLGSQLAVNAAVDALLARLPENAPRDAHDRRAAETLFAHALAAALHAHGQAVAAHPAIPDAKALATTLLIAFTLPCADGWLTAAYWIGDGAIAAHDGERFRLLGRADSGLYAGETRFLNAAAADAPALAARTTLIATARPPRLILMSDGVSDPKFANDAQLAADPPWQTLWTELQTPLAAADPAAALQTWLGFWSPGNHDDRTIALFIPKAHP